MQPDILLNEFRSKMNISEEDYCTYRQLFESHSYQKNEHVFTAGDVPDYVIFITRGCMRIYTDKNRIKRTIYFAEERWWTGDIASMRHGIPTEQNLQALEDCEVLLLRKDNWERAYKNFKWFADFHTEGHLRWVAKLNEQLRRLLVDRPEDNYRRLVQERPSLVKRLPHYYIAGYLGIAPEELPQLHDRVFSSP